MAIAVYDRPAQIGDDYFTRLDDDNLSNQEDIRYGGKYGKKMRTSFMEWYQEYKKPLPQISQEEYLEEDPSWVKRMSDRLKTAWNNRRERILEERLERAGSESIAPKIKKSKTPQKAGNIYEIIGQIKNKKQREIVKTYVQSVLSDGGAHTIAATWCGHCKKFKKSLTIETDSEGNMFGYYERVTDNGSEWVLKPAGSPGVIAPEIARKFKFHYVDGPEAEDFINAKTANMSKSQKQKFIKKLAEDQQIANNFRAILVPAGYKGVPTTINCSGDIFVGGGQGPENIGVILSDYCAAQTEIGIEV